MRYKNKMMESAEDVEAFIAATRNLISEVDITLVNVTVTTDDKGNVIYTSEVKEKNEAN